MADLPLDRALTLRPQWAHAICWHRKRIENRTRPIPSTVPVGSRIAIHAGRFVAGPWWDEVRTASGGTVPRGVEPVAIPRDHSMAVHRESIYGRQHRGYMQCRAIVAVATLTGDMPPDGDRAWGNPGAGRWWLIGEVVVLPRAVPVARGQLGLWRMDAATIDAISAQLEVLCG